MSTDRPSSFSDGPSSLQSPSCAPVCSYGHFLWPGLPSAPRSLGTASCHVGACLSVPTPGCTVTLGSVWKRVTECLCRLLSSVPTPWTAGRRNSAHSAFGKPRAGLEEWRIPGLGGWGGPLPVRLSAAGLSQRRNQLQGRPGAHRQPYTGRAGGLSGNLLLISPEASPGAMRILVGAGASSRALVGEACRTETPEAGRTHPGHSAPCGSGEGLGCRRRSPHAA